MNASETKNAIIILVNINSNLISLTLFFLKILLTSMAIKVRKTIGINGKKTIKNHI